MSHTQGHHVFAGLGEEGANDLITAFFTARPHYLTYGSAPLVGATTVSETQVSPIAAPPLLPQPVPFKLSLSIPVLDLFPPDGPMPELILHPHQFSLTTTAEISLICGADPTGRDPNHGEGKGGRRIDCKLELHAVGRVLDRLGAQGRSVGFAVDQVDIQDIQPACLEEMFNCILLQVINSVLRDVDIPLPVLTAGAFALALEQGPQIDADQVDAWGTI